MSSKGTALITGASTGIGSIYADRLAQRGYDLILVARDQQRLANLAKEITAKTGRKAEVLAADLTAKAGLKHVEERLSSDSSLTALVNNAGFGGVAKLIDSNIDEMEGLRERQTSLNNSRARRSMADSGNCIFLLSLGNPDTSLTRNTPFPTTFVKVWDTSSSLKLSRPTQVSSTESMWNQNALSTRLLSSDTCKTIQYVYIVVPLRGE